MRTPSSYVKLLTDALLIESGNVSTSDKSSESAEAKNLSGTTTGLESLPTDMNEIIVKAAQQAAIHDVLKKFEAIRLSFPSSGMTEQGKFSIQPGIAQGFYIPKNTSAKQSLAAPDPVYDVAAPEWMRKLTDWQTSTGSSEDNRGYWEERINRAEDVIRSYESGEDTFSLDTYESAKELLPQFQDNARNSLPHGLNRLRNIGLGVWNRFAAGIGYVTDKLSDAIDPVGTAEDNLTNYAAYMEAQRQEVLYNYAEMISCLNPDNQRDAEAIRQLTEERDNQLQWIDNIEQEYGESGYLGRRTASAQNYADLIDEWFGAPGRALYDAGMTQAAEAERGLGTVGTFLTRAGTSGLQMLLDSATGNALASMTVRAFGSGAYEAEVSGADLEEQFYQGVKQAAIEYASERLFAGNPVYDQGGGIVTDIGYYAPYKYLGTEGAEKLLRSAAVQVMELPAETLSEGLEEIISDVMNPLVDKIANGIDDGNRDTTMPSKEALLMSGALGVALGSAGHAVTPGFSFRNNQQLGNMSQNSSHSGNYASPLSPSTAERTTVPDAVIRNAKAIMPGVTEDEIQEYYDRYVRETEQNEIIDHKNLDAEDYDSYNRRGEGQVTDAGAPPIVIKCRNKKLEGKNHPVTGVPFVQKQVEKDGTPVIVVVPVFDSYFDAQLPKEMLEMRDRRQFKECNRQLKQAILAVPEIRELFNEEQLAQIKNCQTPDGFTWHHDAETGKMQLVNDTEHEATGHTGGRSIWGGGSKKRSIHI